MHDSHDIDEAPPDVTKGHETRDISTRVVATFGVALFIGGLVVVAAVALLYQQFAREAERAYPRDTRWRASGRRSCRPSRGCRPSRARSCSGCAPRRTGS